LKDPAAAAELACLKHIHLAVAEPPIDLKIEIETLRVFHPSHS
jgi:hypothetical protein